MVKDDYFVLVYRLLAYLTENSTMQRVKAALQDVRSIIG